MERKFKKKSEDVICRKQDEVLIKMKYTLTIDFISRQGLILEDDKPQITVYVKAFNKYSV